MFQSLLCWILYYDSNGYFSIWKKEGGFNPYYVGYCTMTTIPVYITGVSLCFNPYYVGYCTMTNKILIAYSIISHTNATGVSILIMLDTVL